MGDIKIIKTAGAHSYPSKTEIFAKLTEAQRKSIEAYQPNAFVKTLPYTSQTWERVRTTFLGSDRNQRVLNNLQRIYHTGNLAGTGYLSILPVDQGIEHDWLASFVPNPLYAKPENIVKLALEGGCNAVASTFGVLKLVSRNYADRIPFIVKINHNELLSIGKSPEQILFGTVEEAYNLGAAAVGATIYFGSPDARREMVEISQAFARAHELGMATVLWCYLRNDALKKNVDYHVSADGTSQADHIGVTLGADIIKQKLPETDGALTAGLGFGKGSKKYAELMAGAHPIDLARVQVVGAYGGEIPTINSGGESTGKGFEADVAAAVWTALINKFAGGAGLISGRKAFQKSMSEGVQLLQWIQAVYANPELRSPFELA